MKRGELVRYLPVAAYLVVCLAAVTFDLRTDKSFGATMLSTIPLAIIAVACLFASAWANDASRLSLWRAWCGGALLLLLITLMFSIRGVEQEKTGELIFTYALLILAFPASLAIAFTEAALGSALPASTMVRVLLFWGMGVALAYLQWRALIRLRAIIRRRAS